MAFESLQHIGWEDSYILGWKFNARQLLIYLQVLLSKNHEGYLSFDGRKEHGCYRLAILEFSGIRKISSLPANYVEPQWNTRLKEFVDIAEINEMSISDKTLIVAADELSIEVESDSAVLRLVEREVKDAFGCES